MSELNKGGEVNERQQRINAVLDMVPTALYTDPYIDAQGNKGFQNPVRSVIGKGLEALIRIFDVKQGVELGAAQGRSGLHMALGGMLQLETVEYDPLAAQAAQRNFDEAGVSFRVHNVDSAEFTAGWAEPIDFLFIDHAKERYLSDFQALEEHLTPDALVLLDNTFDHATQCADAVAYIADNYYAAIFTEPPTDGQSSGLLVATKSRDVFNTAFQTLLDVRES